MKFGLSKEQFLLLETLVLTPLKEQSAEVYVFGSRARGDHHPFSDLDLLYKEDSNNPLSASALASIKEDLENSNLPIKIDIVNDKNLAKSYRPSVEKDLIKIS